ncbi:MAG: hypothetical protein FJ403_14650 [Verrucomicrobia bacterium]|nr:hypothetical protein [Verrucomicrobiota bacterium]
MPVRVESDEVVLLGICPAGTHVFSNGVYQPNPPVTMGPVRGGSPSGWVGRSQRISPTRVQHWDGHYTPTPVIYLRAESFNSKTRLAVRLRDDQDRYWAAKPEPQGTRSGVRPYLAEVPPDVKTAVAEIVVLNEVRAIFEVRTK